MFPQKDLYSEIGLDRAQTEIVRKMDASFGGEADQLCMRICRERARLLEQIKDKSILPETIDKKVEEIGRLQISLEKKVIAHILQVDQFLTPSQSEAYLEKIYRQQCQMMSQK